jgi:hypothetical protein
MSLLTAYFSARKRGEDAAPATEPETESRDSGAPRSDASKSEARESKPPDRVFGLVPPGIFENGDRPGDREPERPAESERPPDPPASARDVRPIGITDLSRLSIDNDGRLYWDGKPVEVRRRILMSRAQIAGASVIGAFVAIGAIGAAIQGTSAMRDWACRLGWTTSYCTLPDGRPPSMPTVRDIPA